VGLSGKPYWPTTVVLHVDKAVSIGDSGHPAGSGGWSLPTMQRTQVHVEAPNYDVEACPSPFRSLGALIVQPACQQLARTATAHVLATLDVAMPACDYSLEDGLDLST
jgi:hypothetical protein